MSAGEFARSKHDIESEQVEVDRAFARLDDYICKHSGKTELDSSTKPSNQEAAGRCAVLEHLMEAMSKSNAAYKVYVRTLEERIGF
ncbi:MAG: hypothetical protein JRM71_02395 [Nitrososphaerota archaeon]|nr:hypothetical protein [Nitrososphaerota archaeon]